ncbi:hypothetical protein OGAPHI_001024 [Ogataea philodendri]|uniref:Cytochrome b-c1 complex subunit 6, mitochondrial n=1 Tax=Ogataea philodendri TaxID=1378263 RepID=A0A9P8PFH5_9ASCO|nr:uncharacterized protein OGAPHI_001024 [Ogataea philodendri]KAH3670509.1 hypothetical protein OGAPHI_001024 [Ogataea philodendri]
MSFLKDFIDALTPITAYAEEPAEEPVEESAAEDAGDAEEEEEEDEDDDDEDDEDEEEEAGDQLDALRKECSETKDCAHYVHHYHECVERVTKEMEEEGYADKEYKEDCVEEFFHLQHCINDCAAPKLFYKLNSSNSSSLGQLGSSLGSHDTSTPVSSLVLVFLGEVSVDGGDKLGQSSLVLWSDVDQSSNSTGLLVDQGSESSLTLDNGVWNTHLSAQSWEENNKLDWVNIVSDQNQLGLLVLDQRDNVVQSVFDNKWLGRDVLLLLTVSNSSGLLGESLLLLSSSLWSVVVQELEHLSSSVSVQSVGELGDGWRNLQSHGQHLLLSLQSDVFWPFHKSVDGSLWLDSLTNTEVSWSGFNQRVLRTGALASLETGYRMVSIAAPDHATGPAHARDGLTKPVSDGEQMA